jgi:uncharacterized protein YybS (DUF2232 family)
MPGGRDAALGAGWLDALGLAEGGLLADVAIILDLASIYLPIIGTVLAPAVPTPFAVLMLRRGPRVTLLAAAVAAFLITVLAGPHFGWRMGLQAVVGLLLGWAMRRRLRPLLVLGLGTALVASVTFAAALGVIFLTGLPVKDIVGELRNGLGAIAVFAAAGLSLFGGESLWLSIRPTLVALGLLGLRFWPVLLYLYVIAFALPTVALYYGVASAVARVLGHDTRPFPPLWLTALARGAVLVLLSPVLLPRRLLRKVQRSVTRRRRRPDGDAAGDGGVCRDDANERGEDGR